MKEAEFVESIAALLEHLRRVEGKTYRALAQQIGVHHLAVWRVCTGRSPHPSFWLMTRLFSALCITRQDWNDIISDE